MMLIFLTVFLFVSLSNGQTCQSIGTLQSCGYNFTSYNSTVYPDPPASSISTATTFLPALAQLLVTGCSADLQLFACASLFPDCETQRGPCGSLCEKIRDDCSKELVDDVVAFVQLTEMLRCDRYLNVSCIQPSTSSVSPSPTPSPSPSNTISSLNETGCPPPSANYFTDNDKSFAIGWISTWSIFCFLSTLLTLLTFIIKPSRFEYPWRPIVYLALSFNMHSIGYFISLILSPSIVTCPNNNYVTSTITWGWVHSPCLIVFALLYYSMMASFLWWLILTLSWFLSSAFKWSNEAVGRLAPFFHVTAWVIPLLMTIGLVAGQVISADELTGTCFIVRDNTIATLYALLIGVLIPLMLFLLTGLTFLVCGLISACKVVTFLRHKGRKKETVVLEKLMIRIGIFVSIYIVPAGVVIGCFFYELIERPRWMTLAERETCSENCVAANTPVIMVRIFMFLLIGSLTGIWIWSKKTMDSWRNLGNRCFDNKRSSTQQSSGASSSTVNS